MFGQDKLHEYCSFYIYYIRYMLSIEWNCLKGYKFIPVKMTNQIKSEQNRRITKQLHYTSDELIWQVEVV